MIRIQRKQDIKQKAGIYSAKAIEYYVVKNKFLKKRERTPQIEEKIKKKIYDKFEAKKDFKRALQYYLLI